MASETQKKKSKLYFTTLLNAPYETRRNSQWLKSLNLAYGYYSRLIDGKSPVSGTNKSLFNKLFEKLQEIGIGEGRESETSEYAKYKYCGSGTDILGNMRKGILPINLLDESCFFHDLAYLMAGNVSREEAKKIVRKADEDLVARANAIANNENTERSLIDQSTKASTAINAKIKLENSGVMDPLSFIAFHRNIKSSDKQKQYAIRLDNSFERSKDYLKNILMSQPQIFGKKAESILDLEEGIIDPVDLLLESKVSEETPFYSLFGISSKQDEEKILSNINTQMSRAPAIDPVFGKSEILTYLRFIGFPTSQIDDSVYENEDFISMIKQLERRKNDLSFTAQKQAVESFIAGIDPEESFSSVSRTDDKNVIDYLSEIRLDIYTREGVLSEQVKRDILIFMEIKGELTESEQREKVEEMILNSLTVPEEEEGAGEERKDEPEGAIAETPVDVAGVIGQRDNVGQEERVDLKADPPMSAMAMTDAKPVVGERNMRPTLFREEGDTVELSRRQEDENRLFYENFTWIDAGFGNGNIQRVPGQNYAGGDIANNRLYTAQVKNEMLKYSGDLFVGDQQHRKKYNISANTRNLVRRPMHSTVQHHQQFIRDSSLPAGAGRKHQMARDNPSWMPSKNVNSRVGHLYYPDVVDGQRL